MKLMKVPIIFMACVFLFIIGLETMRANSLITQDQVGQYWNTVWAIFVLIGGTFSLVRTEWIIKKNIELATKLSERGGVFKIFEKQAEEYKKPYMLAFTKILTIFFIVIAVSILLNYYTEVRFL